MTLEEHLTQELRDFYRSLPKRPEYGAPRPPQVTTTVVVLSPEESEKFRETRMAQKPLDYQSPSNAIPI